MRPDFLMFVAAVLSAWSAQAQDAPALMKRYDCYICHANEETKTGPAFADVAAKYRADSNAVAITQTFPSSAPGVWGMLFSIPVHRVIVKVVSQRMVQLHPIVELPGN